LFYIVVRRAVAVGTKGALVGYMRCFGALKRRQHGLNETSS